MTAVNKVTLIGNLGADPETRTMPDKSSVTTISLATTENWKNKAGEKKEHTEWHRVVFYKGLADIVAEHMTKGSQVYIEGKLRTRKWEDKEGNDRYTTEVIGQELKMLGKKEPKVPEAPKSGELPPTYEMEEEFPV